MVRFDSSLEYRVRTLSCVLFLGGLIGVIDPIICGEVPPRTLLAFLGGVVLWTILPFLVCTKNVRVSMLLAVVTTFSVFQGCFIIYGDPFYIMLGFAVPVGAALFMKTSDAVVVLVLYCALSITTAVTIWYGLWVPPYVIEGADLGLNVKQTITGSAVIVAIAVSTIWKERLFAGPTERERLQQQRFETVCENGYDAIIEADENGLVNFAIGELITNLGFQMDEIVGLNHLEFLCPGDRSEFLRNVDFSDGSFRYDLETRVEDRDKVPTWVRISGGSFYDAQGRLKWVHGIREIGDQIQHRENIFEISRLESLGSVCGGLAHDFNNLLTVIGIFADRISDQEVKANILQAQSQATDLTSGLLTFARRQKFREQNLILASFLNNSIPLVEKIVKESIQFSWQIECQDAVIFVDPAQIQQVLINLVTNSDHAMPNGGKLEIHAEKVDVLPDSVLKDSRLDQNYVVVQITDNGQGMDCEVARRAIEPFYTTKPRGKGTGLGLAMVHGIVSHAGGMVTIKSEVDRGTTVSLFFPCKEIDKPTHIPQHHLSSENQSTLSARILLVEDRDLVGKAIAQGLEIAGGTVTLKSNAEDAWRILEESSFDFVICDLVLPGMSGIELIEKASAKYDKLLSILISGHQHQDLDYIKSNPDKVKFIPKPFSTSQIIRLMKSMSDQAAASRTTRS